MTLRLQIELVYDPGCPNVGDTRTLLTRVLRSVGAPAVWREWRTDDPACPEELQGYGSPTVLVNGRDVAPGPHPWDPRDQSAGPRCRTYQLGDEAVGVPPEARVYAAIQEALGPDVV